MELGKNIFFNTDKLIENAVVKISYNGKFFQSDYKPDVYLHYGFTPMWENVNEVKMERTELGYQALIYLDGKESLNFCFKSSAGEWDNNNGENYTFEIAPLSQALVPMQEVALETPEVKHKFPALYFTWERIKFSVRQAVRYLPKLFNFTYNTDTENQDNSYR